MLWLSVNGYTPSMNIQITCDGFDLTPAISALIQQKVDDRLERLLTKFAPEMKSALIRIQKDNFGNFIVNFDMNLPGKETVYAEAKHKLLESAIIDLSEEVERQIVKYKSTLTERSLIN